MHNEKWTAKNVHCPLFTLKLRLQALFNQEADEVDNAV